MGGGGYEDSAARAFAAVQAKNRIKEKTQLFWVKVTVKKMTPIWIKNLYHRIKS